MPTIATRQPLIFSLMVSAMPTSVISTATNSTGSMGQVGAHADLPLYPSARTNGGFVAQQRIFRDITETMGGTPLIQLNRVAADLPGRVVVKHEGFNPFN